MASGKNPKHNARARLYRARVKLAGAMQSMEEAIGVVLAQPGAVYKRGEVESLLEDLRKLKEAHQLERWQGRNSNSSSALQDLSSACVP